VILKLIMLSKVIHCSLQGKNQLLDCILKISIILTYQSHVTCMNLVKWLRLWIALENSLLTLRDKRDFANCFTIYLLSLVLVYLLKNYLEDDDKF